MIEYSGSIHIHSNYSDGTGKVEDIVRAAQEAELNYLILTDHNTLRAKREGFEGLYGDTYLMVGYEINDKENKNHCLVFGTEDTLPTRLAVNEYLKIIHKQDGVTFIAHPTEKRNSSKEYPSYPWTNWDTDLFTGIEIWNHMSEWMEQLNDQNRYELFLHPLKSIKAPDPEALAIWDTINLKRKVPGLGGVDAHAHKVNVMGFFEVEVFPYKVLFKSIRTHILLSHTFQNIFSASGRDGVNREIRDALASGRSFVANHSVGEANGFRFVARSGKQVFQMGDTVPAGDDVELGIQLPKSGGMLRIIFNGEIFGEYTKPEEYIPVNQPGIYRVEVFLDGRAWIYSNHIRYAI